MRVQLLCDQKWRDLPGLIALKLFLEKLGNTVLITSTKDYISLAKFFRPDCIVVNNLFTPAMVADAKELKKSGVVVVHMPTEGAVRPEYQPIAEGKYGDFSAQDLYLGWNQPTADGVRRRINGQPETCLVTGCGRIDFYSPRFASAVLTRRQFCAKYGLDADRPIVSWASAYPYAYYMSADELRRRAFVGQLEVTGMAECLRHIGVEPAELPRIHHEGRKIAADAFFRLAAAMPHVQFILKPHPVENRDYYRGLMAQFGTSNVRFCPQEYIWNVLSAVDVHLHRYCTTACEAWAFGKPTIEMGMDNHSIIRWPDREAGSDWASDVDQLVGLVGRYLENGGAIDPALASLRNDYIERWFGPVDGRRTETAAQAVDHFLRSRRRRSAFAPIGSCQRVSRAEAAKSALRWCLGLSPDMSLRGRRGAAVELSEDKYLRRADIRNHERLLRPAIDKGSQKP